MATLALWRVYASPVRRSSKFKHSRTQIRSIKDKESRSNSRLSSFRRYSVACIITRSVPRHSFTVRLPMDWMILAASGSRTTEIGYVAVVISLPLVVTSWRSARCRTRATIPESYCPHNAPSSWSASIASRTHVRMSENSSLDSYS